jgi:uncharacterized membrane protein
MNVYLLLKVVHLLAVVAFLGNITIGLFWMRYAYKTNDTGYLQHTVSGIIAADRLFTIPGVIIITAGGIAAALQGNIALLSTGWIFWSILLFTLSGVFFGIKVAPLQTKMKRYLEASNADGSYDKKKFNRIFKEWEFWGLLALLTPVISFFLMVLKWPEWSPLAK